MIIAKEYIRLLASTKEQTSPSMYLTTHTHTHTQGKPREKSNEKRDLKMFFKNGKLKFEV